MALHDRVIMRLTQKIQSEDASWGYELADLLIEDVIEFLRDIDEQHVAEMVEDEYTAE